MLGQLVTLFSVLQSRLTDLRLFPLHYHRLLQRILRSCTGNGVGVGVERAVSGVPAPTPLVLPLCTLAVVSMHLQSKCWTFLVLLLC